VLSYKLRTNTPKVAVWYDADDATPPSVATAWAVALQRSNVVYLDLTKTTEFYFEPRCSPVAYNNGYLVGKTKQWVNLANLDVEHYGMKLAWMSGGNTGDSNFMDIVFKYYLRLKYGQ